MAAALVCQIVYFSVLKTPEPAIPAIDPKTNNVRDRRKQKGADNDEGGLGVGVYNNDDPRRFVFRYYPKKDKQKYFKYVDVISGKKQEKKNNRNRQLVIPERLFQKGASHVLPIIVKRYMKKWYWMNPNMEHFFADDEDMYPLAAHFYNDTVVQALKDLPLAVMRADVFRLMFIYQYGGLYADTDIEPRRPMHTFLEPHCRFYCEEMNEELLSQYFFAASPKNPIIGHVLDGALRRIATGKKVSSNDVMNLAGPQAFTDSVLEFIVQNYYADGAGDGDEEKGQPSLLQYDPQQIDIAKLIKDNKQWLSTKGICIDTKYKRRFWDKKRKSITHTHHYASSNGNANWRSTGWHSWRADRVEEANVSDPELVKNGVIPASRPY